MPHHGLRSRSQRPRHRAIALLTALTATLTGFGAQAFADDRPFAIPPGNTTPPVTQPSTPPDGPLQIARAKAKSSGKPVTVNELTTETVLIVANPDGTVTRTNNLQPARVKLNGTWTPVDATLAKNPDGTLSPKATPSAVTLSGGGTSPLAAFADAAGHHLALSMPFALPAPTISGDTATYTSVLPGVDLKATVTDQGAFREVLVVHDATAAANPQLKALRLATSGSSGLTTSTDADGNFIAKAADGTPVFTAPTPVMWDSSKPSRNAATRALSDGAPAPAGKNTGPVEATDNPDSSDKGPGRGAHITPLKVQSDSDSLTLTPDPSALGGSDVAWPLFIDPYVNPVPGRTNNYTEVKEGCPSQTLFNQAQTNGEGIGYQQYDSNCFGLYRSFYEFDISYLTSRMVISNSTLYFTETYGADNGCNNQWPVSLELTGGISSGTAWPGPNVMTGLGTQNVKSSSISSSCGNHPVNFDVTSTVKQYWNNGNLTFGLTGNESKTASNYGFMRFSTNPYMQTTYDIPPNAPGGISTTPDSVPSGPACGSGTPGWIGLTTLNGNASNLTLNAQLTTDMSGVNLQGRYHVWDNMVNNGSGLPADAPGAMGWPVSPNWVASGGTVRTSIGGPLQDGHQYGWNVWAADGTLGGPGSPYCYFNVDLTPPSMATITSSSVPPLGSGQTPTGYAGGAPLTFHVSSIDPTPAGCTLNACIASGMTGFQYSLDTNVPVGGGTSIAATPGAGGVGTADIQLTIPAGQWGTHTLYVRSVDKAGNTQAAPASYSFYLPWNPNAKVAPGDLTGDGVPDLLVTTPDGNLNLVKGDADPSAPTVVSTPAKSPNGDSWNNYLVAHRGTIGQQSYDDLFAYSKPQRALYTYRNDADATPAGTPGHFTHTELISQSQPKPACKDTPTLTCAAMGYNSTDWSGVTQMIAPGTFSAAAYQATHPTEKVGQAPDLITVENGKLWYYIAGTGGDTYFDSAYPIGTGDWNITTIIAPGTVGGTVASGAVSGGTPTMWARNNVTGAISSFTLTFDASGYPTPTLAAPTRAPLVSAITTSSGGSLCLEAQNGNTANGTPIQLGNCNSSDQQSLTLGTDASVHLLGKCLDVANGNLTATAVVDLFDCNGTDAQKWSTNGDGTLRNVKSGLCLDDTQAANTPGGYQASIYTCVTGAPEQNWTGGVGKGALPSPQPVLPLGVSSKTYPTIVSPGDLHTSGNPDLAVVDGTGQISIYTGTAPVGGLAQFAGYLPQALGAMHQTNANWPLTTPVNGQVVDTVGQHPGTAVGNVEFKSDTVNGNATTVAVFSGGSGNEIDTAGTAVDTTHSFSITLWAEATSTGGVIASQDGNRASGFILWPESSDNTWRFAMGDTDDDSWSYDQTIYPLGPAAAVKLGQWTKLTASYDSVTGRTNLWVNGQLAGTGTHYTKSGITGPLVLGRYKYRGAATTDFNGRISNVTVNDYAIPVTATGTATSAMAGVNKCLDNANGAGTAGNKVQIWDCTPGAASQQWSFNPDGTVTQAGSCLDVNGNGTLNNTPVQMGACNGSGSQQWIPRADGTLLNPASGRCLSDPAAMTGNGIQQILWDCLPGHTEQQWLLQNLTSA